MTKEELTNKYFPVSSGFGHRKTYVELQKNMQNKFLSDLNEAIRSELYGYYNYCMDNYNGNVSEEAIDMYLNPEQK